MSVQVGTYRYVLTCTRCIGFQMYIHDPLRWIYVVYPWIYHVYPMHIGQDGIYMGYTWYIPGIYRKSGFQMLPLGGASVDTRRRVACHRRRCRERLCRASAALLPPPSARGSASGSLPPPPSAAPRFSRHAAVLGAHALALTTESLGPAVRIVGQP